MGEVVAMNISGGLDYSPTDDITSKKKLHNFFVGSDSSLYRMPVLKNIKNTLGFKYSPTQEASNIKYAPSPIVDVKMYSTLPYPLQGTTEYFEESENGTDYVKCYAYLTLYTLGCLNLDGSSNVIEFDYYDLLRYALTGHDFEVDIANGLYGLTFYGTNDGGLYYPYRMWSKRTSGRVGSWGLTKESDYTWSIDCDVFSSKLVIDYASSRDRAYNDYSDGNMLVSEASSGSLNHAYMELFEFSDGWVKYEKKNGDPLVPQQCKVRRNVYTTNSIRAFFTTQFDFFIVGANDGVDADEVVDLHFDYVEFGPKGENTPRYLRNICSRYLRHDGGVSSSWISPSCKKINENEHTYSIPMADNAVWPYTTPILDYEYDLEYKDDVDTSLWLPTMTPQRIIRDFALGPVVLGNRMFFYSTYDNSFYVTEPNKFSKLVSVKKTVKGKETYKDGKNTQVVYRRVAPGVLIDIIEFNGNLIAFSGRGVERWVLTDGDNGYIERDPTFNFPHRLYMPGCCCVGDRKLYYLTQDFQVYEMDTSFSVKPLFNGDLPSYEVLEDFVDFNKSFPVRYFEMLSYKFICVGPWLYNLDTKTWSTYTYDGLKNKPVLKGEGDIDVDESNIGKTNTNHDRCIAFGVDKLVCTYSTFCKSLTYKEIKDLSSDDLLPENNTNETDKYQWGSPAFFSTGIYQDDNYFSIDQVEVMVRAGSFESGSSSMYMKIIQGDDDGAFDHSDTSTWGIKATYRKISDKKYTGKFVFPRPNVKTDRFRLQFITDEVRGFAVEAVLVTLTKQSTTGQNSNDNRG